MAGYPRFSVAERRKLTLSDRARESFRTIGIRGGADPAQGAPTSTPPYYTLSEDDRATFEATMNMTRDNDIKKSVTAKGALNTALQDNPVILAAVNALYGTQIGAVPVGQVGEIAWMALRFAGYLTETAWEIPESEGFCSSGNSIGTGFSSFELGEVSGGSQPYSAAGGHAFNTERGAAFEAIVKETNRWTYQVTYPTACVPIICRNGVKVAEGATCNPGGGIIAVDAPGGVSFVDGQFHSYTDEYWFEHIYSVVRTNLDGLSSGAPCSSNWSLEGSVSVGEGDEVSAGFMEPDGTMRCDVGEGTSLPSPGLSDMEPAAATDLPITDIPLNDLCDIIDALKNDPALQDILPDTLPDPVTPPIDPNTGLPPGTLPEQPPDPGANPLPGEPLPDVPTVPGDPNVPPGVPIAPDLPPGAIPPVTDPIDSGIQDPEDGACMTLAGKPAGFTDPTQPGGISRKFQPGQPITIDYGSGSSCRTKITRVKTEKGTEGGPEVCASPTIDNGGKLTDKECYGPGPVVDEINTLLGDMVAEGGNIIFDSECARELHRPMCFRAGTSKRMILNKLLDMCGFCVFPMFDCNVIVGYCGPVNVHWTYHEDVDLMAFDLEYDGQEVYDYVQVFRGDKMDQAGRILEVGGDVFYPVGSPASSVSGDRVYQHEVPYGTPQADMLGIAMTLAAKLRAQAMPLVAFGVPLNSQLRTRHQLHFKRPSLGFDAVYMVTKLARDYDRENGHLSTGLARWLRGS